LICEAAKLTLESCLAILPLLRISKKLKIKMSEITKKKKNKKQTTYLTSFFHYQYNSNKYEWNFGQVF